MSPEGFVGSRGSEKTGFWGSQPHPPQEPGEVQHPISALMFPRITAWWADVIDEPDYESDYPALPSWADPPTSDDEYDHLGRNVSAQLRRQSLVPWKLVVRGKDYEL